MQYQEDGLTKIDTAPVHDQVPDDFEAADEAAFSYAEPLKMIGELTLATVSTIEQIRSEVAKDLLVMGPEGAICQQVYVRGHPKEVVHLALQGKPPT